MPDYKGILVDLRHERDELRGQIAKLEQAISALEKIAPSEALNLPAALRTLPYYGMTVVDAARMCLETNDQPMNTHELCEELLANGIQTKAKSFRTSVYSVLFRDEDFVSDEGMWSLAKWKR